MENESFSRDGEKNFFSPCSAGVGPGPLTFQYRLQHFWRHLEHFMPKSGFLVNELHIHIINALGRLFLQMHMDSPLSSANAECVPNSRKTVL